MYMHVKYVKYVTNAPSQYYIHHVNELHFRYCYHGNTELREEYISSRVTINVRISPPRDCHRPGSDGSGAVRGVGGRSALVLCVMHEYRAGSWL